MAINLDFSNVKQNTLIPEGDEVFLIEDATVKAAKSGGSDNLVIKASVVGGDNDGKNITLYLNLGENSLWNVKLFMEALMGEEIETLDIEEEALMGQTFVGTIRHTEDGKYANIVAFDSTN